MTGSSRVIHNGPIKRYEFSEDWFSFYAMPSFEKFLGKYKDKECRFLEVGCFEGRSAVWMLENIMTHNKSKLWCIDPWCSWAEKTLPIFIRNINITNRQDRVEIIKGLAESHIRKTPENYFDFIYIDGDHSEAAVLEDAILSFRALKLGGIIAFDDYLWDGSVSKVNSEELKKVVFSSIPKKAIDFFLDIFKNKIEILLKDYQVWVKKIRN